MKALPFGTVAGQRLGIASAQTMPDTAASPADAAWMVLEAANDLDDHATIEICRRVIDASLNGRPASPSDVQVVLGYFV